MLILETSGNYGDWLIIASSELDNNANKAIEEVCAADLNWRR